MKTRIYATPAVKGLKGRAESALSGDNVGEKASHIVSLWTSHPDDKRTRPPELSAELAGSKLSRGQTQTSNNRAGSGRAGIKAACVSPRRDRTSSHPSCRLTTPHETPAAGGQDIQYSQQQRLKYDTKHRHGSKMSNTHMTRLTKTRNCKIWS